MPGKGKSPKATIYIARGVLSICLYLHMHDGRFCINMTGINQGVGPLFSILSNCESPV